MEKVHLFACKRIFGLSLKIVTYKHIEIPTLCYTCCSSHWVLASVIAMLYQLVSWRKCAIYYIYYKWRETNLVCQEYASHCFLWDVAMCECSSSLGLKKCFLRLFSRACKHFQVRYINWAAIYTQSSLADDNLVFMSWSIRRWSKSCGLWVFCCMGDY